MSESTVHVAIEGAAYDVYVGGGVRSRVGRWLETDARESGGAPDRVATIADERVLDLHGALGLDGETLALPGGEAIKTFSCLERVLEFCASAQLSRGSVLVAYGGGTIGDLTGLAASLFKRGLRVVQVPTTLLSQVDASVGGKTAVNLAAGKNLAGTFHQPAAVFCDTALLGTLDDDEYKSGLGEVLKTALIEGPESLAALERQAEVLGQRSQMALDDVVLRSVETKARVVVSDPEERGPRRSLNLGHTFGHAIEHAAGYGRIPHGIAVGVGLELAARASVTALPGTHPDLAKRVAGLLRAHQLPESLDALREHYGLASDLTAPALIEGLGHDKKGRVGAPEFVLMRGPGDIELGVPLERPHLEALFR